MLQVNNDPRQSVCTIVQCSVEPVMIDSSDEQRQKRAFARCVSVLLSTCQDYIGPDINMVKIAGTYPVMETVKKKVAEAADKHARADLKKVKTKRQNTCDVFNDKEAIDRMAQSLKIFIKAACNIELKGGKVKFDAQQMLGYLQMGCKEFPDDSLLASLSAKISAGNNEASTVRDITKPFIKIKQTGKLPTPTKQAFRIFRLANDDNINISDLAAVVETDPAIVARILKIANSAFYKSLSPTRSVQDAIVRLGLQMLKKITLGLSLISHNTKGPCTEFDYEMFWSESLARAITARNINYAKNNIFDADEVFTVGLLCQIGRLAFATAYPEEYARLLKQVGNSDPALLRELEYKVFGIDHNELAAEMMSDWHLPDIFCKAVRFQDSIDDQKNLAPGSPEYELAWILQWPVKMSLILTQSSMKLSFLKSIIDEADRLGLGIEFLDQKFDIIVHEWWDMGAIFEVQTRSVLPWKDIYAQIK